MKKLSIILLVLSSVGFVMGQGKHVSQNEDIQFIKQWQREQKAAEIAELLALSSDQVATLRDIKSRVETVKADFEPQETQLKDALAVAAAEVRANIESSSVFSEADQELLMTYKTQARELRQEKRLSIQMATIGLEDVLTEEQVELLKSLRPNRGQGDEQAIRSRRGGGEKGAKKGRGQGRQNKGKRIARLLLSDAFLNSYP